MFLGVRQRLCVCVLGHVFVRVCVPVLEGKQSLNKETMPFNVSPENEGRREERERNVGRMERENEACMGVY